MRVYNERQFSHANFNDVDGRSVNEVHKTLFVAVVDNNH